MSPFAKLMSRFGWIRLSSFGLELSLDGSLVPAGTGAQHLLDTWGEVPAPRLDLAAAFDPSLAQVQARQTLLQPPALPSVLPRATPPAIPKIAPRPVAAKAAVLNPRPDQAVQEELSEEDEWAWQAAVAKAKAEAEAEADSGDEQTQCETKIAGQSDTESDEEVGFADTAPLRRSKKAPLRPLQTEPETAEEETENWELLVQAARERAEQEAATKEMNAYDDTKIDHGPEARMPDFASAQVETSALAANDDLPAESVTSINAIKLRPLAAARRSQADDDEWTTMRTQIDAREREESARKLRAMREIRRLQGRAPLQDFKPGRASSPPRRRMGVGTSPAPMALSPSRTQSLLPLRPSGKASSETACGEDTRVDLPRATERLGR